MKLLLAAMAAILPAACSPGFDRALEARAVYDAVFAESVSWDSQPINVFVNTISDGDTELTLTYLRRNRHRGTVAFGPWLPALADYVSRRDVPSRLEGGFTAPHRMIDKANPTMRPDHGSWIAFSVVGFDRHGRHAIVFAQRGSFDGDGGDGLFLMLERTEAGWRIARRKRVYVI